MIPFTNTSLSVDVLLTLTSDFGKIHTALSKVKISGSTQFTNAIEVASVRINN